jgi:mono/diheme cytochrome c family protein
MCAIFVSSGIALAVEPQLGTDEQREAGKEIYDKMCAQCHGVKGDGNSVAKDYFMPTPRDFTYGLFKIRTTESGELPSHEDLRTVIKNGMPYTGMPGCPGLSGQELDNVIYYITTLVEDFADPDMLAEPIEIPKAPRFSEESAQMGALIYEENKCADCHGTLGRTDGKSAPTLVNEWNEPIRPADLTKRWTFRGGPSREDIYRTFTTGLNGTPMPSYADLIEEEDRWHLVDFVYSLSRDEPEYATVVIATGIEGEIDLDQGESVFEGAAPAFFPVIGQIVEPGRSFFPAANAIEVRAVYSANEIAMMVSWNDMSAETEGANSPSLKAPRFDPQAEENTLGQRFSDAVAIQTPSQDLSGVGKPYFLFGDPQNSVDIWFADLAQDEGELLVGRGSQSIEPLETIPVRSTYDAGEWRVIFKRNRYPEEGLSFGEDQFIPVAFSIWDGFSAEHGNRRGLTPWNNLYLQPLHSESRVMPIAGFAILTVLIEVALIQMVRIRSRRPGFTFLSWSRAVGKSQKMNVDLGFSLIGGLVATIAMTIFLYLIMPTLSHRPFDIGGLVGQSLDVGWGLGVATHFVLGALVFPLFFVGYFYPRFPGPSWVKGAVWGGLLWLVAEVAVIPIVNGGMFHAGSGGAGAAAGFLVGHLLYGVVLGAVAGSSGPGGEEVGDSAL